MINYLLRRMWKNKWLMLSLFVGNVLLIGIVAATPLYTQATVQRILIQELRRTQFEEKHHPAIVDLRFALNTLVPEHIIPHYFNTRDTIVPEIADTIGLPVSMHIETNTLSNWHLIPAQERESVVRIRNMSLMGISGLAEHVNIVQGRMPSSTLVDGNIIEALATETALIDQNLLIDELLPVQNVNSEKGNLYVRIVGAYENRLGSELFWSTLSFNRTNTVLISNDLVRDYFIESYVNYYRNVAHWHLLLDYSAMSARRIGHYLESLSAFYTRFTINTNAWQFGENFSEIIIAHNERTSALAVTLWVLQVPLYLLLASYIYMVSRQILLLELNEISVLKSRGVSRLQLLGVYLMQGLVVAGVSMPAGVWLGVLLCRLLGASSGFLYLVRRAALEIVITPTVIMYAGAAMAFSFLTMFLPVIGFSRVTVVEHKQRKRGYASAKAVWQRLYLDILCFGISVYGLYSFNNQRELMSVAMRDTASVDPLLFLSSSLFIIGAGLFALRLFPHVIKVIFMFGRRLWSPQAYAAFIRVVRSAGADSFIMIFLVITVGVGVFSAHAARTINTNSDHRIRYIGGADLMFREFWRSNIPLRTHVHPDEFAPAMPNRVVYHEPDFERFTGFDEVDAITRVKRQDVRVSMPGSTVNGVRLMAIESHTFGKTIWFRDDLLRVHVNHFLNALAENPDGVLLSDNFRTALGYSIGDLLDVRDSYGHTARVEVIGFVDYWPGYTPAVRTRLDTGEWTETSEFLLVANLGYLQTAWGVLPYQVWMRTNTPTNRFFHDFHEQNNLRLVEFNDSKAAMVEMRSDPVLQGINGVLTMGFIVTLLVCFVGFLIYWVLSIRSRILQFGVLRALGMRLSGIFKLLIYEQLLITFTAIGIGAIIGEITAYLFVPLIQISFTAAEQVIPLIVVTESRDYRNLYTVIGAMIAICLVILGTYVSRIKIAQALKFGED